MISRELKNLRHIVTAAVSGKIQLLVLALFIALSALIFMAKGAPPLNVVPLTVVAGLLWFMMGSGCLLMAHHAHQFRLAGVGKKTARALLLIYALLAVLPALFGKSLVAGLAINTTVATVVLLILMSPPQWIGFVSLTPLLFIPNGGLMRYLPIDLSRPDTLWYVALPMLGLAWLRWRSVRQQDCSTQSAATLFTAMRSGAGIGFSNSTSFHLSWLSPKASSRNANTSIARLRTLLGMSFSPGAWQRHASFNFVVFLAASLLVQATLKPSAVNPFLTDAPLVVLVSIVPLTLCFPAQLLFRRKSHDLAELALLPALPGDHKVSWLKRAALCGLGLQAFGIVAGLLLLHALFQFQEMSLAKLVIAVGGAVLSAFAGVTQFMNIAAHPQPKHPILRWLLWMLAMAPGTLTWYFAIHSAQANNIATALGSLVVLALWLAILTWLHARWHRQLAERPHPYLQLS